MKEEKKRSLDHAFTMLLNISETPKFNEQAVLKSEYNSFVRGLKDKQAKWKSGHRLLEHLFYKVHQKYLKKYEPYQSFQDLFETGTYGCLTGTALYAFLLDELGYEYEIIETNYHMFLIVKSDGKRFLLESTDPVHGFEYHPEDIDSRIADAHSKNKTGGGHNVFSYDIYRSISYADLIGLQYYNTAVDAFNKGNIPKTLYSLNEASKFNNPERISGFLKILIESVTNPSTLENAMSTYGGLSGLISVN